MLYLFSLIRAAVMPGSFRWDLGLRQDVEGVVYIVSTILGILILYVRDT